MKKFSRQSLLISLVLIVLMSYPVWSLTGAQGVGSMIIAVLLITINVMAGYYYILVNFNGDGQFVTTIFGGMGVRLLILAIILFIILKFTPVHKNTFIISLFISYIFQSVLEMIFINKLGKTKPSDNNQ